MNAKTLTNPSLTSTAKTILSAHIEAYVSATIDDLRSHIPAINVHFDSPSEPVPAEARTWAYGAYFEAVDDYRSVCWGALRGSLLSRAYSLVSGCPVLMPPELTAPADIPLNLWKALIEGGWVTSYYDISEDEDETARCAHVGGSVIARALGIDLFEHIEAHFKTIENDTKGLFV
uniref:Uncharacterized protein n=1 Tax=Dechloromonas aromatica (strain RCB) TaxID=159087 RepID=Q47D38_DECAR